MRRSIWLANVFNELGGGVKLGVTLINRKRERTTKVSLKVNVSSNGK